MRLSLNSQVRDGVLVILCNGRISFGPEVEALEAEVHKLTRIPGTDFLTVKHVIINLGEVEYVDSSGLGAMIRLLSILRKAGGDLKICQLSPPVAKVIELTNLATLFPHYETEADAMAAFSHRTVHPGEGGSSKTRIVCVDPSNNLLAGLSALLTESGYEVFGTRFVGEAGTLIRAIDPKIVICGPGVTALPTGPAMVEKFRQDKHLEVLQLPGDFQTSEAGQAAVDLLNQVKSLAAAS